jgi:hypothetical protein
LSGVAKKLAYPRPSVFLFCSDSEIGPGQLNAISPAAAPPPAIELSQTDLDMLQELASLTMQLARLAAREALEEPAGQPDQATEPPRRRRADPRLVFLRLSRTVRDIIILKTQLAAGTLRSQPRAATLPPAPAGPFPKSHPTAQAAKLRQDPRRAVILRYFKDAIPQACAPHDVSAILQHTETIIDAEFAKDPTRRFSHTNIIAKICKLLEHPADKNQTPGKFPCPPIPKSAAPANATAPPR